jgi:hypothetical protein
MGNKMVSSGKEEAKTTSSASLAKESNTYIQRTNHNDFTSYTHEKWLREAIRQENVKGSVRQNRTRIAKMESDMLHRTIYVTGFVNVKLHSENIRHIKRFFEQHYESVEFIAPTRKRNVYGGRYNRGKRKAGKRYGRSHNNMSDLLLQLNVASNRDVNEEAPALRIRFENVRAFEKVMATAKNNANCIRCPGLEFLSTPLIPYGRPSSNMFSLHVVECRYYDTILEDVDSTILKFSAKRMVLGHWTSEDLYTEFLEDRDLTENHTQSQWISGYVLDNSLNDLSVRVDLKKRIFEISVTRQNNANFIVGESSNRDYLSFRFKDLDGYFELCYEKVKDSIFQYSFVFSLKYPPKLFSSCPPEVLDLIVDSTELKDDDLGERKRDIEFGGASSSVFGQWLGYKLNLSRNDVEQLLYSKVARKLEDFGVLRKNLFSVKDARFIGDTSISFPNSLSLSFERGMNVSQNFGYHRSKISSSYEKRYTQFHDEMKSLHLFDAFLGKQDTARVALLIDYDNNRKHFNS